MSIPVTQRVDTASLTIANGASLSDAVNLGGRAPVGVLMPAGWTAAALTFQISYDGVTFGDLYAPGVDGVQAEVSHAVAASRFVALDANPFAAARYIKIRSGTAGVPVNQGAERALELISREFW